MMSFLTYITGFFMNFELLPIHLKKFLIEVMAAILDTERRWRTQFWKGTTQGSFQQSLVEIGSAVSVVPFQNCVRQCRPVSKMATITKNRHFFKWPKLLNFKPEWAQIWTVT
jgi:hypothetical protein